MSKGTGSKRLVRAVPCLPALMTSMLEVSSRATLHDSIVILTALSTVKGVAALY